jgi:hypothetical protein
MDSPAVRPANLLARTWIYQIKEHGGAQYETFEYYLGNNNNKKREEGLCMIPCRACVHDRPVHGTDQGAVN